MIDFEAGWRAVPGMLNVLDATVLQRSARMCRPETAIVELGAWCGRSLAAISEVAPNSVKVISVDNYLDDSQAHDDGNAPIPPSVARKLRELVKANYVKQGMDIETIVSEAAEAGRRYKGDPIEMLFVDDHHSFEQIHANMAAWGPHCSDHCILLFHDYGHPPYRIVEACTELLPSKGYKFVGQPLGSGIGIWARGHFK